jgi:hypothetical protein
VKRDSAVALALLFFLGRRRHVRFTLVQLFDLAVQVGFKGDDAHRAAAVAMAESGGDPDAFGDITRGNSRGLWQINQRFHPEYDTVRLFDPVYNAHAAFDLYKRRLGRGESGFADWSTFNDGSYRQFMHGGIA